MIPTSSDEWENDDMGYEQIAAEAASLFFGDDAYEVKKSFADQYKRYVTDTEDERSALGNFNAAREIYGEYRDAGGTSPSLMRAGRRLILRKSATQLQRTPEVTNPPVPKQPKKPLQPPQPIKPPKPKVSLGKSAEFEVYTEISKVDTDKRQVFGWASITKKDGQLVRDLQGDMMETEELEKSAYEYILKSRKGGIEHMRDGDGPKHVADIIESFVVTPEKKKAMGLPTSMPEGWWIGMKINDDKVWNMAKSGDLAGFSIHGKGRRV